MVAFFSLLISCSVSLCYIPNDLKCFYQIVHSPPDSANSLLFALGFELHIGCVQDLSIWCVLHYCVSGGSLLGSCSCRSKKLLLSNLICSYLGISKCLTRITLMVHFNMVISKTSFTKGCGNRLNNYQFPGDLKHIFKVLSPFPGFSYCEGGLFYVMGQLWIPLSSWSLHSFSSSCTIQEAPILNHQSMCFSIFFY